MPITWTKVNYDQRRQDQLTTTADDQGNVTQQRILTLMAIADPTGARPTLADATIASDGTNSVPLVNGIYTVEGQPFYVCTQTYPRRTAEGPFVFEIQVTYTRRFIYQPPETTKWQIEISISGQETTQPAWQGKDMNPSSPTYGSQVDIVNSAGQAFDPSVDETLYDEQIVVSYNTTSPPDFSALRGMVNSEPISFTIRGLSRSYAADSLLLKEASMSTTLTLTDGSTPVWKVQCTLLSRADTFTRNILDQGFYSLNSDSPPKLTAIKDKFGDLLSAAAKLNGAGGELASDGTPVYRPFLIEGEADLTPVFDGLA